MKEQWKDIEGFEGIYKISNLGNVMNLRNDKIMSQTYCKNNYLKIKLSNNGKEKTMQIHRLVAKMFIENPCNKETVNHIDGIKTNNCVFNLEWNTHLENIRHAVKTGLIKRKAVNQLDVDGKIIKTYSSAKEAAKINGFLDANIYLCCNGKFKQSQGFKWEYAK